MDKINVNVLSICVSSDEEWTKIQEMFFNLGFKWDHCNVELYGPIVKKFPLYLNGEVVINKRGNTSKRIYWNEQQPNNYENDSYICINEYFNFREFVKQYTWRVQAHKLGLD